MSSFFGDLFGNFTGAKSASDLAAANTTATGAVNNALTQGTGAYQQATSNLQSGWNPQYIQSALANSLGEVQSGESGALGVLDPYNQTGMGANKQLATALGYGPQGFDPGTLEQVNPYLKSAITYGTQAEDAGAASRGLTNSGANLAAENYVGAQIGTQAVNDYINQLAQQTARGQQAAGQEANISTQAAQEEAGLNTGAANALTQGQFNQAQALAGVQGEQANLDWSGGSTLAGNAINYGNAKAQNENTGLNNLFQTAGLVVSAATGAPVRAGSGNTSTSAFQNIGTGFSNGWNALTGGGSTPSGYPTSGVSYTPASSGSLPWATL